MSFFKLGRNARTTDTPTPTAQGTPTTEPAKPAPKGVDKFQEMLENAAKARAELAKQPNTKNPPTSASSMLTADNLAKLKGSVDFSKAISKEVAERIAQNDPTAIIEAMQAVAAESYALALQQSSLLTDTVSQSHSSYLEDGLASRIQSSITDSKFKDAIPKHSNPIVRMGIESFMQEARLANPDATPEEINTLVKDYVTELNQEFNPAPTSEDEEAQAGTGSWLSFANADQS